MQVLVRLRRGISSTAAKMGVAMASVVVGLGIPGLWIWVGSQFQESTAPSFTALAIVHVGLIGTLLLVAGFFSFFVARSKEKAKARSNWMQGQSEERRKETITDVHPLELVIFFAVFIDIVAVMVWFFFFADVNAPPGQG